MPLGTNTKGSTMNNHPTTGRDEQVDKGFTLVEILIAIVLVGILSAVAVVGISNMLGQGESASCKVTRDSATAAVQVYFAGHNNTYPADFAALTPAVSPALTLPSGVAVDSTDAKKLNGSGWTLTMDTTKTPPALSACPA